jgi:hypothetical protein
MRKREGDWSGVICGDTRKSVTGFSEWRYLGRREIPPRNTMRVSRLGRPEDDHDAETRLAVADASLGTSACDLAPPVV